MPDADVVDFSTLSPDAIASWLVQHRLNLTVDEVLTIQRTLLQRPPTLAECVLWSIQGSEHCSYKSTRTHLTQFVTDSPDVILGPKEDAGIVAVATDHAGLRYGIVMSHESHNHPSQLVPYEGAATGVGGNVRDVCCMGAEVIAIADGLRFGDIHRPKTHFIHEGVVSGIAGYGNPIGVPNLSGDVYYDAGYNDNCLVTVVTLGVVREDQVIHSYAPKAEEEGVFILVGKATDNSGFGGASFASQGLSENQIEQNKGAIQEPNAFLERHLLKANYALFEWLARNQELHRVGFKDLGAGGIACASVELADASGLGADIDLSRVPVSLEGLPGEVVLCAETQERFMWVVPPHLVDVILKHYNETFDLPNIAEKAAATVIGKIRRDGLYHVTDRGKTLIHAKASDITKGIRYDRPYVLPEVASVEPTLPPPKDFNALLLRILSHENVASRAPVFERYDKQVQGRTYFERGEADSGVLQPFNESRYPEEIRSVGIALATAHSPRYNKIDAYWGAVAAVCEAVRRVVAVGAFPVCITDCLCFGNPEKPEEMGAFVAAVKGIADACRAVTLPGHEEATLPIISGNVSLYNNSAQGSIPPSPMISCLGRLPDVNRALNFSLKQARSVLILVGARQDECGGSIYYQLHDALGSHVPKPQFELFNREIHAVYEAIQAGIVLSAHTITQGGIATALAEMSFKNEMGLRVTVPGDLPIEKLLFSETSGFVLEVARDQVKAVQQIFQRFQTDTITLGETTEDAHLRMNNVIEMSVKEAKLAWENGLREKLL